MQDRPERYDGVSIFLHWSIGIGIILVGLTEMLRGEIFARGSIAREALKAIHEPAGLVIFALILVRIAWRIAHPAPRMPPDMRVWEVSAARLMHLALYALIILVPVLGLATTAARGRPIDFGMFQLAVPFAGTMTRNTARALKELHEITGQLLLALAFVHAAAGIWHHYVRRDGVLTRMLPTKRTAVG